MSRLTRSHADFHRGLAAGPGASGSGFGDCPAADASRPSQLDGWAAASRCGDRRTDHPPLSQLLADLCSVWVTEGSLRRPVGRAVTLPIREGKWYVGYMSGTYTLVVGNKGRIVVPAEVRERAGLAEGTALVMLDTPNGLVLLTRAQLRARVREELSGLTLVDDLLAERRRIAQQEDVA